MKNIIQSISNRRGDWGNRLTVKLSNLLTKLKLSTPDYNRIKRGQTLGIWIILSLWLFLLLPLSATAQGTLSLENYLEAVKKNNLQYLAEQHNVKIADAEVTAQKVFPDPELSFDASEAVYAFDLGYTLEPGKRAARVQAARSAADAEKLALEYYFQELRAEATEAFLDAVLKKELWQVKQSSYEYMLQLSHSDSIRFALGETGKIDLRQSRLEAATLYNEMLVQQAEYLASAALLNRYMGRAVDELVELPTFRHVAETKYSLAELLQLGSDNRVDIMLALQNSKTADAMLRLVKAERRPDIGLHIGYERDWKGIAPSRDMMTAGISIPLAFSRINKGAVRSAGFAVAQSELRLRDIKSRVETEITQAYIRYGAMREQVMQYHSGLLDESQKVLEGIVFRYRRGETGILDVLIAQRTCNDIREQYFEALKAYHSAIVELQRSCGVWGM
jgi:cobalt-zinc-cadmium efflux system outer membrane protein